MSHTFDPPSSITYLMAIKYSLHILIASFIQQNPDGKKNYHTFYRNFLNFLIFPTYLSLERSF